MVVSAAAELGRSAAEGVRANLPCPATAATNRLYAAVKYEEIWPTAKVLLRFAAEMRCTCNKGLWPWMDTGILRWKSAFGPSQPSIMDCLFRKRLMPSVSIAQRFTAGSDDTSNRVTPACGDGRSAATQRKLCGHRLRGSNESSWHRRRTLGSKRTCGRSADCTRCWSIS